MTQLATRAFHRYTQLLEEFIRRKKLGPISEETHQRFEDAMTECERGMHPDERIMLEDKRDKMAAEIMVAQNAVPFTLDTSKPPYEVPCPKCGANALGPCKSKSKPEDRYPGMKFPADARILREPHPERQQSWDEHPLWRVRAMK